MVKMDPSAHEILKKWKKKLRKKGVCVSLGGVIREMDRIVSSVQDDKHFLRKDLKALTSALEVLKKYRAPEFSDAIREMDATINEMNSKKEGFDYMKGRNDGD